MTRRAVGAGLLWLWEKELEELRFSERVFFLRNAMSFTTPAYFGCLKAPLTRSDLERRIFLDGDRSWYP